MAKKATSGKAAVAKLMARAREIARKGECLGFSDVLSDLRKVDEDAALTLKLWAGSKEWDEIEYLCNKAREQRRFK